MSDDRPSPKRSADSPLDFVVTVKAYPSVGVKTVEATCVAA